MYSKARKAIETRTPPPRSHTHFLPPPPLSNVVVLERGVPWLCALDESLRKGGELLRLGLRNRQDLSIRETERSLEVWQDLVEDLDLREGNRAVERGLGAELLHAFLYSELSAIR